MFFADIMSHMIFFLSCVVTDFLFVSENHEFICFKLEKTKQELKSKDVQSKKMEETIHGLDLKLKDKDLKIKTLQDKVLFRELCRQIRL